MALKKWRVVVLASGRGSNFAAIAAAVQSGGLPNVELVSLICNRSKAGALGIARDLGLPVSIILGNKRLPDAYNDELLGELRRLKPDLICLAGYMKILPPSTVREFQGKILNIHPSLLPKYKGLQAQKQALEAGETKTGCTVHWVTEELDGGPMIEQDTIEILPGDTEESLSTRLRPVEHRTYIKALQKITAVGVPVRDRRPSSDIP